jgi:tyrosine recombinase XerC
MTERFSRFIQYLTIEKNASEHTVQSYQTDLTQFFTFIEDQLSFDEHSAIENQIERHHLRIWLSELSQADMARATIARKIAALRTYFKFLKRRGYISENPTTHLPVPKKQQQLPVTLSKKDINYLFSLIETESVWGKQTKAIFELLYGTGLRLSELVSLTENSFDFQKQTLKVLGKGNKERIIPFGNQARTALNDFLEHRSTLAKPKTQSVFVTKKGEKIYPKLIQRLAKDFIQRSSEATKQSPHVLRHTFATHLLDNGADINAIKEMLGHASLAATQVYTHTSVEHLKKTFNQAHPRA